MLKLEYCGDFFAPQGTYLKKAYRMKNNVELKLENQAIKTEFLVKGLDLYEIWNEPEDPIRANQELKAILACIRLVKSDMDKVEELIKRYISPPIKDLSIPHEEWAIFKNWVNGKPTIEYLQDLINLKNPESISNDEIEDELEELISQIENYGTAIDLYVKTAPPLLKYQMLYEWIINENPTVYYSGGWIMDGCGHFCPNCLLRPWCDMGADLIWQEDEEIEDIYYRTELANYVSSWPPMYPILKDEYEEREAAMERSIAEMKKRH